MVDKPFSIFDSPAKKQPEEKKSKSPSAPAPPLKPVPINSEVDELIGKMKTMHDDLERKLDEVYRQNGMDKRTIKNYLDNPSNFTPEQWERVQEDRKLRLETLAKKIGAELPTALVEAVKEVKKTDKSRKSLGVRRNWIPMR